MKNETKKDRDGKGKKQKRDEASLDKRTETGSVRLGLACFDSEPGLLIGLFFVLSITIIFCCSPKNALVKD